MIPAVARTESRNPASKAHSGSIRSSPVIAQPSAAAAVPGRPSSRASSATPAMTPARTTDGDGPTKATYMTIATAVRTARRRRWSPPAIAPRVDATIAMFQPLIATTWLAPAIVKASARSRSTRSRSPMSTPAASPASGSGIERSMPSAAVRRKPSRVRSTVPVAGMSSTRSARNVPIAPIFARYSPYSSSGGGRIPPETSTRSPGTTAGNQGSVAATRIGSAPSTSSSIVAGRVPTLGAPTVWTVPTHGPSPFGSALDARGGSPAAAVRSEMARTPIARTVRRRLAVPRRSPRAATARSRRTGPRRCAAASGARPIARLPAVAPTASQAGRGIG